MRKLLFAVAIAGLLVSGYLFITYAFGWPIVCNTGHGCDIVRASEYASFGGVSTPFYGLIFYGLLAVGALLVTPERWGRMRWWLLGLTTIGVAVSVYLTYLEAFVIGAWCSWCILSALLALVAYGLVLWYWSRSGRRAFTAAGEDATITL